MILMMILMMITTRKVPFINYPEAEAGDVVISRLKMDGNVLNVDLPCPKGNTCEAIMKSVWAVAEFCLMYPKIW